MFFRNKHNRGRQSSGFTLIEIVVAMMAFGIIMAIVGAVFVRAVALQRRALDSQKVQENLQSVLEAMAREIRVSQISGPDSNCPTTFAGTVNISHPVNGSISYYASGGLVHRVVNGTDSVISSNVVSFSQLEFCISGTTVGTQPRVTILGTVKSSDGQVSSDFQTTLSQRYLNNQ